MESTVETSSCNAGKSFGSPVSLGGESKIWRLVAVNHFYVYLMKLYFSVAKN